MKITGRETVQVINSPEILCIYRAHLPTTANKISAADILRDEEKTAETWPCLLTRI